MQKSISFVVNNQKLTGTIFSPKLIKTPVPAVLFIHGWTSNEKGYRPRAQPVSQIGYVCLTFNMRGHGTSEGSLEILSREDHLQDCIGVYDFLASQPLINKTQIHVVGASYGGYLALLLSTKRKIRSLVLRAPELYSDEKFTTPTSKLIKKDINTYRQQNLNYSQNKSLSALRRFKGDILLIESEKDDVVPKATTNNYLRSVNNIEKVTHVVITKADHGLS